MPGAQELHIRGLFSRCWPGDRYHLLNMKRIPMWLWVNTNYTKNGYLNIPTVRCFDPQSYCVSIATQALTLLDAPTITQITSLTSKFVGSKHVAVHPIWGFTNGNMLQPLGTNRGNSKRSGSPTVHRQVYAHKLLCMRCSYFRAMFDGQMREASSQALTVRHGNHWGSDSE